jgi:diguanylate cyclase (GGDEF)-like protein
MLCGRSAIFFYNSAGAVFPDTLILIVANILFMLAIALESLAVLMLYDSKRVRTKKAYHIMISVFSIAFVLFYVFGAQQPLRIEIISLFSIAFVAYPALYLLTNKNGSYLQRIMGFLYLLVMAAFFLRTLNAAGIFWADPALREEGHSWVNFALFVMMILSGSGYFLLAKERTDIRLLERANTDSLTGILNRRAFIEQSRRTIRYLQRKKQPVSFMIFDIDSFKKINDTFGHYVGDTVLREISTMMSDSLRGYDFLGRYGGDEFTILLPAADEKDSYLVAERLRQVVEARAIYEHTKLRITICIGLVTVVPDENTDLDALYRLADEALYEAKISGGNCIARRGEKLPKSD